VFAEDLDRMKNQKSLISVYTDIDNTCKFAAGYVIGIDRQYFILALITPAGEYDGFLLKGIDSIYKIGAGELYLNKLSKLVDIKKTKPNVSFDGDDLKNELLIFAQKHRKIASIELIHSGYDDCVGFIESIDETMCKIQEIDEFGTPDGISTIKLSDITQISIDDTDNRPRKLLYELK
jgi:hypothetical protein